MNWLKITLAVIFSTSSLMVFCGNGQLKPIRGDANFNPAAGSRIVTFTPDRESNASKIIQDDFYADESQANDFLQKSLSFVKRDKVSEEKLAVMNSKYWRLEKLWPKKELTWMIYASARDTLTGKIFFLTNDNFDFQIFSFAVNETPKVEYSIPRPRAGLAGKWQINIQDGRILATNLSDAYFSVPGKKKLFQIPELPFPKPISMWVASNRIMLLGEDTMMSCDEKGRNRIIHFSQKQATKQLSIQQKFPEGKFAFGCMGETQDEAIMIFTTGRNRKAFLLKLNITNNEVTEISILPSGDTSSYRVEQDGDMLFINWSQYPWDIASMQMRYSFKRNELQIISANGGRFQGSVNKWLCEQAPIQLEKSRKVGGKIIIDADRYLLYAGPEDPHKLITQGCAGVIDLTQFPGGPALRLPVVRGLYPAGYDELIAVECYQITRISPTNRK